MNRQHRFACALHRRRRRGLQEQSGYLAFEPVRVFRLELSFFALAGVGEQSSPDRVRVDSDLGRSHPVLGDERLELIQCDVDSRLRIPRSGEKREDEIGSQDRDDQAEPWAASRWSSRHG